MRLFLASEGGDPLTTAKLELYLGGFSGKKVIYIPTAKNGNGEGRWRESKTWKFLESSGMEPICLELENYLHGIDAKPFSKADIIWVTGGAAGYLMYWVYRTGFNELLGELLRTKLYVGSSAGSMITSPTLNVCDWYIGEIEKGAKFLPGLGLVDFDFYPHYEDTLYKKIKTRYDGNKIYLVKNGEEIIVEDGKVSIIGEERVIDRS